MSDIKCPYCFHPQDIPEEMEIHEDVRYDYSCEHCKKLFILSGFISYHFVTEKQQDEINNEPQ